MSSPSLAVKPTSASASPPDPNPSPPLSSTSTSTSSFFSSTRSLIALQLLSRIVTFSLNQILIRLASAKVFGTANVQFDLLRDTILFLSREGVRGVVGRIPSQTENGASVSRTEKEKGKGGNKSDGSSRVASATQWRQIRNLLLLPSVIAVPITLTVLSLYLQFLPFSTSAQPCFFPSLTLYIASTITEVIIVEPLYLYSLIEGEEPNIRLRVRAEGAAVILKAAVTTAAIVSFPQVKISGSGDIEVGKRDWSLLAFACGQAAYSGALVWCFVREYSSKKHRGRLLLWNDPGSTKTQELDPQPLEPSTLADNSRFKLEHLRLVTAITAQSVFKHFLTEGDRLVVAWTSPLEDQGGYAVASNYASLVARIVFQPIEESSRMYFSRTLGDISSASAASSTRLQPFRILTNLVRISFFLLTVCPAFVPPLAPLILPYLLPRQYLSTSAPTTLTVYLTLYLPLLSLNGILESFFAATSGVRGLGQQSVFMVGCSGAFAGSLLVLDRLRKHLISGSNSSSSSRAGWTSKASQAWIPWLNPEVTLVYANCVQMACRIAFAARYVINMYTATSSRPHPHQRKPRPRLRILPSTITLVTVGISGVFIKTVSDKIHWEQNIKNQIIVLGLTGLSGLICLGVFYLSEKKEWEEVRQEEEDGQEHLKTE